MIRTACALLTALVVAAALHPLRIALAQQPVGDSVDRDYTAELPRIAPQSPEDALQTFQLLDDFEIRLLAAEPLVADPVAIAFDEDGRLFVVEMRGYSEHDEDRLGRIRCLTDTDGDGRYDKAKVFAQDLSWPTAIACSRGGVFVAAAPDIWFLKDGDGDGQAEIRERVLTGFGRGNVQGLVNSFNWGLDMWIHGATSSSGAALERVAPGSAETTSPSALDLRGRDFAFRPRAFAVVPASGGGQHGLSFDVWGHKFVCSNSDHIQQVMFEDRYLARNPYLAAPQSRVSIAADGPQSDVYRRSPLEPWRIVRTRLRVKGLVPGPVEGGGKPAGYFTGATGITIYRGNAWPSEFLGLALIGDVGSNLVHRKRIDQRAVQFVAHRMDSTAEFLASSDIWFRPVQMANGPLGGLYVVDMYREVIEHPKSLPPLIKKHLDLNSGRDRGRIYCVVPREFSFPPPPRLGQASLEELVKTLDHANDWHRETAARLLVERGQRSVQPLLRRLAGAATLAEGRIRALRVLRALAGEGQPDVDSLLAALRDQHPQVRRHAVQLSEAAAAAEEDLRAEIYRLVRQEADPQVRYQLAFSLGQWRGTLRNQMLAKLLQQNASDRWIRFAALSSLQQGAGEVLAILGSEREFRESASGADVLRQLSAQIGKQQRPEDVAAAANLLRDLAEESPQTMSIIMQGLAAKPESRLGQIISATTKGQSDELRTTMIRQALVEARSAEDAARRMHAIHLLRLASFAECRDLFQQLLQPDQRVDIQTAALATLSEFESPQVAELLIDNWNTFSPQLRNQAADVLMGQPRWLSLVAEAVAKNQLPAMELGRDRLLALAAHSDPTVSQQAQKLLAHVPVSNRTEVLKTYQRALTLKGDVEAGRKAFRKICAACHQVEGFGHAIGPNLAAMRNRGDDAVLLNVLDPNRQVNPQYVSYSLITTRGKSLSGLVAAETATSVTLQRAENAQDTALRIDIEELRSSGKSLMPEGLEKEISVQAMADLLAYLKSVP